MRRISQDNGSLANVVRKAFHAHQRQRSVAKIVRYEALHADQRNRVPEVLVKEIQKRGPVRQGFKLSRRHEQSDRKGSILIGQPDHHELAARPDVQVVGRHQVALEAAARGAGVGGRDGQLHVGVGDVFLAVVEAWPFHHLLADG